jgi:hypothetical protein
MDMTRKIKFVLEFAEDVTPEEANEIYKDLMNSARSKLLKKATMDINPDSREPNNEN